MPSYFDYKQNRYVYDRSGKWDDDADDDREADKERDLTAEIAKEYASGIPWSRSNLGKKKSGLELYMNEGLHINHTGGPVGNGRYELVRYRGFKRLPWSLEFGSQDAICLTADHDVNLHGILLPSICDKEEKVGEYKGKVEIWEDETKWKEAKEGSGVASVPYREKIHEQEVHPVTVPFVDTWGISIRVPLIPAAGKAAITLKAGVKYDFVWCLEGPSSTRGVDGLEECEMAGVTFKFENSESSSNGTHSFEGQVPGFIWSHA